MLLFTRFFGIFFPSNSLTALIADGATRLASGLASASAFAAAGNFLLCGFSYRFNHDKKFSLDTSLYNYRIRKAKNQAKTSDYFKLRLFKVNGNYARYCPCRSAEK